MRVRLSERCSLGEVGDVVEVAENIQALNSSWMKPTKDELTQPEEAPSPEEIGQQNADTAHAVDALHDAQAAKASNKKK